MLLFLLALRIDAFHDPSHPFPPPEIVEAIGPLELIGVWKQLCSKDRCLRTGDEDADPLPDPS
jgi:hypothetical protein